MTYRSLVAALPLLVLTALAEEAAPGPARLDIGAPAPALAPGRWLKGEPVSGFETGRIYVLAFWASWCEPYQDAVPALTDLQAKFKDRGVAIIGQNCAEDDESAAESAVRELDAQIGYRVALDRREKPDDERGLMARGWLDAAGEQGLPLAFVVDQSRRIAWIGHPMDGLDEVLTALLAGTFDPAAARRAQEERAALFGKFALALEEQRWDDALRAIDEVEKAVPAMADEMALARFGVLVEKGDAAAAQRAASGLLEAHRNDAEVLNEVAWTLITSDTLPAPDLALAERIARAASLAAEEKEPAILDTLARVLFMKGEKEQALALQEKAVALADDDSREMFRETLASYKAGKLPPAEPAPEGGGDDEERSEPGAGPDH